MALYPKYGRAVDAIGYAEEDGRYKLCCRFPDGHCVFYDINELRADNGLKEIEQAFVRFLGHSPWYHTESQAKCTRRIFT